MNTAFPGLPYSLNVLVLLKLGNTRISQIMFNKELAWKISGHEHPLIVWTFSRFCMKKPPGVSLLLHWIFRISANIKLLAYKPSPGGHICSPNVKKKWWLYHLLVCNMRTYLHGYNNQQLQVMRFVRSNYFKMFLGTLGAAVYCNLFILCAQDKGS